MWKHTENFGLPAVIYGAACGLVAIADWRIALSIFSIIFPIGVVICYAVDWTNTRRAARG